MKDVLFPKGQGSTFEGQDVLGVLLIQKEPLEAWMGPLRGLLLKDMSRVKGLAVLWRAARGAARVDEVVASRARVLVMVSFMLARLM